MSNVLDPAVKQRDVKLCLKAKHYMTPRGSTAVSRKSNLNFAIFSRKIFPLD